MNDNNERKSLVLWSLVPFLQTGIIFLLYSVYWSVGQRHEGFLVPVGIWLCALVIYCAWKIEKARI